MLRALHKQWVLPVVALLATSACDTTASLQALRNAPAAESAYHQALSTLYQAYAETEMTAYDWWTSKYFADKGLMVAYGKFVEPENPAAWNVPIETMADLTSSRTALMAAMTPEAIAAQPQQAATAMAAYDCWVEQQDDGWKIDRIALCRSEFEKSLAALKAGPQPIMPPTKPAPAEPEVTKSVLYFPFDAEALEKTGMHILHRLIDYLTNAGDVEVVINGHADRVGSDAYNLALSEKRAKYVRSQLMEAGITEPRISYFAFGESDPEVPTADGVAEPANRRVEIFLE